MSEPTTRPITADDAITRLRTGAHPEARARTRREQRQHRKIDRALCAMLRDGEITAAVNDDGHLHFTANGPRP